MMRRILVMLLMLVISACGTNVVSNVSPTQTIETRSGTFAGYYLSSFEVSSFVPCEMGGFPGYGKGYWTFSTDPKFGQEYGIFQQITPTYSPKDREGPGYPGGPIVYIRFEGTVSPLQANAHVEQNGYGHLNQYEREISIDKLLEMEIAANQCQTR